MSQRFGRRGVGPTLTPREKDVCQSWVDNGTNDARLLAVAATSVEQFQAEGNVVIDDVEARLADAE